MSLKIKQKLMQQIAEREKKIILHLCADLGSDSRYYQLDNDYEVIMVGEKNRC